MYESRCRYKPAGMRWLPTGTIRGPPGTEPGTVNRVVAFSPFLTAISAFPCGQERGERIYCPHSSSTLRDPQLREPESLVLRIPFVIILAGLVTALLATSTTVPAKETVNLSPLAWPKGEYEQFMQAQEKERTEAGVATGRNGAVTVAYNGLAARAGLE